MHTSDLLIIDIKVVIFVQAKYNYMEAVIESSVNSEVIETLLPEF